jgi:hypothetical protein
VRVTQVDDEDDENSRDADAGPVRLDYFAAADPQRVASRGLMTSSVLLLLSWGPYLCGVVNAAASAKSYVPTVTSVHVNASVLFLAVGLVMAVVSLIRFLAARHYLGASIAGVVVLMQVTIAGCIGLA